jgi:hypothetical protein
MAYMYMCMLCEMLPMTKQAVSNVCGCTDSVRLRKLRDIQAVLVVDRLSCRNEETWFVWQLAD